MSLYGVMRTGVSGMNAQSSKLSTVADNIANSSTNGYKRASAEFASMIINSGTENTPPAGSTPGFATTSANRAISPTRPR